MGSVRISHLLKWLDGATPLAPAPGEGPVRPVSVSLHEGTIAALKARTDKRGMSAYVEALIQRQLERDRLRALNRLPGPLSVPPLDHVLTDLCGDFTDADPYSTTIWRSLAVFSSPTSALTETGHVPREARNKVDVLRVDLQVDQQLTSLRRTQAGKVPQSLIRPVLLALNSVHTVPEPEQGLVDRARQLHQQRMLDVGRPGNRPPPHPAGHLHAAAHRGHGLKPEQVAAEESVADQVDRAPVLAHGMHVVAGEVAGDADQARAGGLTPKGQTPLDLYVCQISEVVLRTG